MSNAIDPQSLGDVFCVHAGGVLTGIASFDLNDGLRIDPGRYSHVLVLIANGGGTTAGSVTITPKDSDTQSGPEFPLDGTNGAPDHRMTFSSASDVASRQRVIRARGIKRFLNFTVAMSATGTIRPCIYVIGYGAAALSGVNIESNLTSLNVT